MNSLPVTRPAPDLPAGPRAALVVAVGSYTDTALTQLRSTARDAAEMAKVLADAEIGSFEVTSVVDRTAQEIRLAVEDFLEGRSPADLIVVYLSCHGLLDRQDRLYFGATDTRKDRLAATGVEAGWLWDRLEECRAASQVVILDCCNSGAFGRAGGKGEEDTDLRLQERFITQGRGRAVLTASRANQRSWEGDATGEMAGPSVFTSALVEGLRTGAADLDHDGYISVEEAYQYAYRKVIASNAGQVPQQSISTGEGSLLLARNPAGWTITPAPLTEDLRAALDSPHPAIRLGAVNALGSWLTDPDPAKALRAEQALQRIAANEVVVVASAARAFLNERDAAESPAAQVTESPVEQVTEPRPQETPERNEGATLHTAHWTSTGAARFLAAGFGILLIAFFANAAIILLETTAPGPRWAVVAISALGIVVTLGGVRKNAVLATVLLWNMAWAIVYWVSILGPSHFSSSTKSVVVAISVIGAIGNGGLCIWILVLKAKGRDVDPLLAIVAVFTSVAYLLAAIAWSAFPALSWPLWNAVAANLIAAGLVGVPALLRALHADLPAVEHGALGA